MIGQTISHYKILEKLGSGGMGVVYKAQDTKLDRSVALKFLPVDLTHDPGAVDRFVNEAHAASALDHANICTIHEISETEEGQMFIVMAYYAGETLQEKIKRGPLPIEETINIFTQAAQGLERAHEAGITHRDIKPSNLIITPRGEVKIIDFGLAKLTGQARLTKTGTTLGTVAYMSPEQIQLFDMDHRTDIWSLGVVLYEMLTGKLPFRGDHEAAMIYAIVTEKPDPLAQHRTDVPDGLQQVIDKALVKDVETRYQDVEEMLSDLALLKNTPASATSKLRPATVAPRKSKRAYLYWGIAGFLLLLLGIGFYAAKKSTTKHSDQYRIAVLPLDNLSPDANDEYFADSMTEELISTLSKIDRFRVIARTSVMQYKGGVKSIAEIGGELKVATILTGSVRKADNKLRITAQLIDVSRQESLWTQNYDREFKEVFAIQSDIAQRVAEALQTKLLAHEKRKIAKKATENLEAYMLYLKGRFFWNKRTPEDFAKGMAYFEQAIAQDSCYALAYAGLADSYAILGTVEHGGLSVPEAVTKARAAVEKALACDDQCAEAHASLANIRYTYEWDWQDAEREFTRAIALKPGYTMAHHWYAHYLAARGRLDQAMAEIKLAQELDPLSLIVNTAVGMISYFARQPDQAIEQLRMTLEIDPNFVAAQLQLGVVYARERRFEEAIAEFQKAIKLAGEHPVMLALLGYAYAASGRRSEALALLDQLQQPSWQPLVSPSHVALVYLGLDEKDRVFEWLEKAGEERANYLIYLNVEPLVDNLRGDPRFTALLKKVGL